MRLFGRLVYDIAVSGAVEGGGESGTVAGGIDFFGATESQRIQWKQRMLPRSVGQALGWPFNIGP